MDKRIIDAIALEENGGLITDGETVEPITGNEIPPGSSSEDVRDDIPAQLSPNEYVVPADVLRYYGVRFFEDLRAQAKQGMMEMESEGRIGGTPVDAQGAPLEGQEEELTPEEEQMLQEALGAASGAGAPAGMAMGGMIPASFQQQQQQPMTSPYQDQAMLYKPPASGMAEGGFASALNPAFGATTFDRSQFTSDTGVAPMETRQYINPTTKEVRSFSFLNGNPLSPIPGGFVPWSQELQDQASAPIPLPVKTPEPVQNRKSEGDRANEQRAIDLSLGRTAGTEGQQGTSRSVDEWAKENYETFNANPYQFGMDALSSIEGPGKAGKIPLIGKIAGIGSDIRALDNISSARAALLRLDPNTEEAKTLSNAIDKAVENIGSNVIELGATVFAQGSGKSRAMEALAGTPPTTAPTTTAPAAAAPSRPRTTGGGSSNAASQLSASDRARAAGASAAEGARIGANLTAAQAAVRPKGGSGKAKDDVATPSRPTTTSSTGALKRNVRQQKANVTSVAAKAAPKKATVPTIGKGRAKGGLITRPEK
jgi:hypothetical protein